MAYCSKDDVESDFKDIEFTDSTKVTSGEVTSITEQESAYIDSMISSRYVVPVTGDNSLLVLKKICIALSSDRVRNILITKTGKDELDQDTKGMIAVSRARKDLQAIQDGTLRLIDAPVITTKIGFDTGCKEVFFEPSKDQW